MNTRAFAWQLLCIVGILCPGLTSGAAPAGSPYAESWAPGVSPGSKAPKIAARDQFGKSQNLKSLTGEKGLLFLFSRSVSW